MTLGESLRLALAGLWANKLRALLTLLGIIIGIASVVAIMTLSEGITQSVTKSLNSIGGTDMYVRVDTKENIAKMKSNDNGSYVDSANVPNKEDSDYITTDFLEKLRSDFANRIEGVSVSGAGGFGTVTYREKQVDVSNQSTNQDFLIGSNQEMLAGRGFTADEVLDGEPVAVISEKMLKEVFGGNKNLALGAEFSYSAGNGDMTFKVIGIYRSVKGKGIGGALTGGLSGDDNQFYIPYTLGDEVNGTTTRGFEYATIRPKASGNLKALRDEIQRYFDKQWETSQNFGVIVVSMENAMKQLNQLFGTISLGLSAIAGLSLLVGGIGVMNIMLVSVTERTREIGIRKALGATRSNIRSQFIIEAMMVCLLGGILGVILGGVGGYYGGAVMDASALPPLGALIFAPAFSVGIGVFFGYYPASKAAKLDPIEALRFE